MNIEKNLIKRKRKYINRTIEKYKLDLDGLAVFTEAASGNYMYTALIAASAGARRVYAIAADSRFGTREEIEEKLLRESKTLGLDGILQIVHEKNDKVLMDCDIVTNLGFVRPINRDLIFKLKTTAVISLMWETWEMRSDELDLKACHDRGILVMGTNEHHQLLNLFRSIGFKVCKLLFNSGLSVYEDNFLLISSGEYGDSIANFFTNNSIQYDRITCDEKGVKKSKSLIDRIDEYDALIIAELNHNVDIISRNGIVSASEIRSKNPLIKIIYICGVVDESEIINKDLEMYPQESRAFGHITISADYLGWKPVLDLNTAGLKVGEAMARARISGLSLKESESHALKNSPADAFLE